MSRHRQILPILNMLVLSSCASYVPPKEGPQAQFTFINNSSVIQPFMYTYAEPHCKNMIFFDLPKEQQGNQNPMGDSTRMRLGGKWTTTIRADQPFQFGIAGGENLGVIAATCPYVTKLIPKEGASYEMNFDYKSDVKRCKLILEEIKADGSRVVVKEPEFRSFFNPSREEPCP